LYSKLCFSLVPSITVELLVKAGTGPIHSLAVTADDKKIITGTFITSASWCVGQIIFFVPPPPLPPRNARAIAYRTVHTGTTHI
jgi:hypothetical protein